MVQEPSEEVRAAYRATRDFYDDLRPKLDRAAFGFRILYGPPIAGAPICFLGDQPGGDHDDAVRGLSAGEHDGWPDNCEYAVAEWKLARRLRQIWDSNTLAGFTGLNTNFFRASNASDWKKVDRSVRRAAETFSAEWAERITLALKPQRIVVIGLKTFDKLGNGETVLKDESQKRLVVEGTVWGIPALGTVHLSGCWISADNFERISEIMHSP